VLVPSGQLAGEYSACARAFLSTGLDRSEYSTVGYMEVAAGDKTPNISSEFQRECLHRPRAILVSETKDLPASVLVAADAVVQVEAITEHDLREACKAVLELKVTVKQALELLSYPRDAMFSSLHRKRPVSESLRRLRALPRTFFSVEPVEERSQGLEELYGYGEAKAWGMQLAADLKLWQSGKLKWSDVDKGLLLSGPPGVGKTIFAKALSITCGVPLVSTSVAQWQAKGHLGDLLKAMRADFATAISKAPSIIFLDELDSIGDRNTFNHDYAPYSTQVVNALLECLDGTGKRDGLVVIGATNYPNNIDPAVRRPGRLDRHVVIRLPDEDDRLAIIRHHLGPDYLFDLADLGPLTEAMAGSDLAQLVRDAKQQARRDGRGVTLADLVSRLPPLIPVTGAYRRAAAVHEAGHALVGIRLGYGEFRGAFVHRQLNPRFSKQEAGAAGFEVPLVSLQNERRFRDQICVLLAGIAAEKLIFGSHSDGAEADLAEATRLALQMETQIGMGTKLLCLGKSSGWQEFSFQQYPWLVESVDAVLVRELARGTEILAREQHLLLAAADEIDKQARLTPERFAELDAVNEEGKVDGRSKVKSGPKVERHRDSHSPASSSKEGQL
jgi:DNA polymerase III delta prime subunit